MTTSEEAAFLPRSVITSDQVATEPAGRARRPQTRTAERQARPKPARPVRPRTRKASRNAGFEPEGPHVRLGVAWALVTLAALLGGPAWAAVWMAPAAALAAASSQRSWHDRPDWRRRNQPVGPTGSAPLDSAPAPDGFDRRAGRREMVGPEDSGDRRLAGRPEPAAPADSGRRGPASRPGVVQPPVLLAAGAAGLITLVSAAGPVATIAISIVVAVGILVAATLGPRSDPGPARRLLIVLLPAAGASGLVLSRAQGLPSGMVLAGMVCVYDSAAYLIGTDAKWPWEGPVAGLASVAALTVLVAAVLAPPFRGSSPWILGGLAAILAPLGPRVARQLIRDPAARVPALRRLDSLLLLGPAWAVAAALLAHT
jgi:hypothetical protein